MMLFCLCLPFTCWCYVIFIPEVECAMFDGKVKISTRKNAFTWTENRKRRKCNGRKVFIRVFYPIFFSWWSHFSVSLRSTRAKKEENSFLVHLYGFMFTLCDMWAWASWYIMIYAVTQRLLRKRLNIMPTAYILPCFWGVLRPNKIRNDLDTLSNLVFVYSTDVIHSSDGNQFNLYFFFRFNIFCKLKYFLHIFGLSYSKQKNT